MSHTLRNIPPQKPPAQKKNFALDLFPYWVIIYPLLGIRKEFSKDPLSRPNQIDKDLIYHKLQIKLNQIKSNYQATLFIVTSTASQFEILMLDATGCFAI